MDAGARHADACQGAQGRRGAAARQPGRSGRVPVRRAGHQRRGALRQRPDPRQPRPDRGDRPLHLIPLGIYVVMPRRAAGILAALRAWLIAHQRKVVAWVLLVFGVLLIASALTVLLVAPG